MLANVHRDPRKTRAYKPADFDPHAIPGAVLPKTKDLTILRDVFIPGHQKEKAS
jgi:hypothetical protein